jgi:hypothetical protein
MTGSSRDLRTFSAETVLSRLNASAFLPQSAANDTPSKAQISLATDREIRTGFVSFISSSRLDGFCFSAKVPNHSANKPLRDPMMEIVHDIDILSLIVRVTTPSHVMHCLRCLIAEKSPPDDRCSSNCLVDICDQSVSLVAGSFPRPFSPERDAQENTDRP